MGALSHHGKQAGGIVLLVVLLYGVTMVIAQPSMRDVDAEDYCRGYRFGWPTGYCGHDDDCRAPPPRSCPLPQKVRGPSLVAGVAAGVSAGAMESGASDKRPDPPDLKGF